MKPAAHQRLHVAPGADDRRVTAPLTCRWCDRVAWYVLPIARKLTAACPEHRAELVRRAAGG